MTRKLQIGVVAPERDLDFLMAAIEWRAADALDAVTLVPLPVGSPAATLVLAGADAVIIGGAIDDEGDATSIRGALATVRSLAAQDERHTVLALAIWGSAAAALADELAHPATVLPPAGAESAPAPDELAERLRVTAETVRPMSDAARYELLAAVAALTAQEAPASDAAEQWDTERERLERELVDARAELESLRAQAAQTRDWAVRLERKLEDAHAARQRGDDEAWRRASAAEAAAAELRGRAEELASQLYREAERADAAEAAKKISDDRVRELYAVEDELERARDEAAAAAARAAEADAGLREAVARLDEAEGVIVELRRSSAESEARLAELRASISSAELGLGSADERAQRAEAAARDLEARASAASGKLAQLESDRADLSELVESLRAELASRRVPVDEQRPGSDGREGRRIELEQRLRRVEAERTALASRLGELERDRSTADALKRHFDAEREAFRARERRLIGLLEAARGGKPGDAQPPSDVHDGEVAPAAAETGLATIGTGDGGERVTRLLSGLSHELRSAMSAVVGFTSLLLDGPVDDGRDLLGRIDRNARAVLHVFNNVLDLAKLEEGTMERDAEPVELEAEVAAAGATAAAVVGVAPSMHVDVDPAVATIAADRDLLRQALANVVAAVARHASEVRVTARADGDRVTLTVAGTGAREEGPDHATTPGDALGMTAARRVAGVLGGELEERDHEVRLSLPRSGRAAREDDESMLQRLADGAVLLLAGDPNEAFLVRKYLDDAGRGVVAAASAKEALSLAGRARPEFAVVDADDPGALSLIGALATQGTAVVGFGSGEWREDARRGGAAAYLARPIDRNALVRALEGGSSTSRRVLVVDDEEDARELLAGALERRGYAVTAVAGGREALDRLGVERPDLIVLDLMMPTMDGFEVAYHLNSSHDWRTIPVLLVTAKDLRPEERRALGASVVKIVQKGSFGGREIADEVDAVLRERSGYAAGR